MYCVEQELSRECLREWVVKQECASGSKIKGDEMKIDGMDTSGNPLNVCRMLLIYY
jgi:hypothetical protein